MSNISLIMTRVPLQEVNKGKMNGRWGKMVVVRGAKVLSGSYTGSVGFSSPAAILINFAMGAMSATSVGTHKVNGKPVVKLGYQCVALNTEGSGDVEVLAEFDTLERFRTDDDKSNAMLDLN